MTLYSGQADSCRNVKWSRTAVSVKQRRHEARQRGRSEHPSTRNIVEREAAYLAKAPDEIVGLVAEDGVASPRVSATERGAVEYPAVDVQASAHHAVGAPRAAEGERVARAVMPEALFASGSGRRSHPSRQSQRTVISATCAMSCISWTKPHASPCVADSASISSAGGLSIVAM